MLMSPTQKSSYGYKLQYAHQVCLTEKEWSAPKVTCQRSAEKPPLSSPGNAGEPQVRASASLANFVSFSAGGIRSSSDRRHPAHDGKCN